MERLKDDIFNLPVNEPEYDSAGNLIKQTCYIDGGLDSIAEYGAISGNLIKKDFYNRSGNPDWSIVCEYDDNGKLSTKNLYNDGQLIKKEFYNEHGQIIQREWYENNHLSSVWEYGPHGRHTKLERYDKDGILANYTLYKCDSSGNIIELGTYDSNGKHTY